MSSDLSRRLKAAGPVQVAPLILSQVQARASRWRVQRFIIAGATTVVLIGSGAATWIAVDLNRPGPTQPAGPDACPPSNYDIALFLEDEVTASDLKTLQRRIGRFEKVETVAYFSVEATFAEFKNYYADQPELWITLPEDALPASLRLTMTPDATAADIDRVIREASGLAGIDGVRRGATEDRCRKLRGSDDDVAAIRVPRLVGRNLRRACQITEGKVLLRVSGDETPGLCGTDAVVATQDPPPGRAVRAGTTVTVTLSPAKGAPPRAEQPLDDLTIRLQLKRDSVRAGGRVGSTLIIENTSRQPVVDPSCYLSSPSFGIVKRLGAELWQAYVVNCGGPRTIAAGARERISGPQFIATDGREPLAPGTYLAVVELRGRSQRLPVPVEVTGN